MPQARGLIILLLALALVGSATAWIKFQAAAGSAWLPWSLFLIVIPLVLAGSNGMGWGWAGMACVIYGTVGLALDIATVTSMIAMKDSDAGLLAVSGVSGCLNLSLIVLGGLAFVRSLQGVSPPGSRPPNPPFPSSTS